MKITTQLQDRQAVSPVDNSTLLKVAFIYLCTNFNPHSSLFPELPVGWLISLAGTILIITTLRKKHQKSFLKKLGLATSIQTIAIYLFILLIVLTGMWFLFSYLSHRQGYLYTPALLFSFFPAIPFFDPVPPQKLASHYLYHIPQTLNDEMVIGALLLFTLRNRLKKCNCIFISLTVAALFSAAHSLFYFISPIPQGTLGITTLFSLFCAGYIRNMLIFKTDSIYSSWILHMSWNILFFPGYFFNAETNEFLLGEVGKLNLILGTHTALTGFLLSVMLITLFFYWGGKHRKPELIDYNT